MITLIKPKNTSNSPTSYVYTTVGLFNITNSITISKAFDLLDD